MKSRCKRFWQSESIHQSFRWSDDDLLPVIVFISLIITTFLIRISHDFHDYFITRTPF